MSECERCGTSENLITHHDSYEPEVTRVLCTVCHGRVHSSNDIPKRPEGWRYPVHADLTTVKISTETRAALNALKRGVESQDAVIRRLIRGYVEPIRGELAEWMRPLIDPILEAEG